MLRLVSNLPSDHTEKCRGSECRREADYAIILRFDDKSKAYAFWCRYCIEEHQARWKLSVPWPDRFDLPD